VTDDDRVIASYLLKVADLPTQPAFSTSTEVT